MEIFELIPIEMRGMSVITLIVLSFFVAGFIEYSKMVKNELNIINKTIQEHEIKIDDYHNAMTIMRTDIALLLQSVGRIEELLKDRDRRRD